MKHALVIGGSGMLSKASHWLAGEEYIVTVIGRNQSKLDKLSEKNEMIKTISVDYYNENAFILSIKNAIKTFGTFQLVIAWIHSREDEVISILSDIQSSESSESWDLYHVLGSSDNLKDIQRKVNLDNKCEYH